MGSDQTKSLALEQIQRPIVTLEDEYPANFTDGRHKHSRSQLLYASAGLMLVNTDIQTYVVPPQRALWIPAHTYHSVYTRSELSLRSLYVAPDAHPMLPQQCVVIGVSDLLRSLILQAICSPDEYEINGREGRIMRLILDEIALLQKAPLTLPMPKDMRLQKCCQTFLDDPSQEADLEFWAHISGMSRRSFTRLFRQQTQMSFTNWRQQARLLEAVARLATGLPITTVAYDVGYNSSSSFSTVFHKVFGVPPSQYLKVLEAPAI